VDIELVEIRDFLASRPPFDALPEDILNRLPKWLEIRYLRRGSEFPPGDVKETFLYIVRRGAIELRDAEGNLREKLGEGDLFTTPCQLVDLAAGGTGAAVEDTLLYLLPCSRLTELRKESASFDQHFSSSIRERLKRAVTQVQETGFSEMAQMTVEAGTLIKRPPVVVPATLSIRETAEIMTDQDVSSVLVSDNEKLVGLITDRDLRRRFVAKGLDPGEPASSIMSTNLHTISKRTLLIQALMAMTRLNIHHLPIIDGERPIGMVTSTDIAHQQTTNPAFLAADINRAQTAEDLVKVSKRLPELQIQLANSSASARHIGDVISCITDVITKKLIALAEDRLGPPPVPYAWLCCGSQARHEQSSYSDQDNAMIISDEMKPEHDEYFSALARSVCDGLNTCGYAYCPGGAMALNDQWRKPVREWRRYFDTWINRPEPKALMLSSIFFDMRAVHGNDGLFKLELQRHVLRQTKVNRIFIAYMASNALQHRPPLGFFRTFVLIHGGEHDDTFDIKHRGIVPIIDIGRIVALSEGLPVANTTDRLRAASALGGLSTEMAENLEDALEFISSLRMRHQARLLRGGKRANNFLGPSELSELEREHLKDAFGVIKDMQETMESRYQLARFR